jgi:hypothetical protein
MPHGATLVLRSLSAGDVRVPVLLLEITIHISFGREIYHGCLDTDRDKDHRHPFQSACADALSSLLYFGSTAFPVMLSLAV